MEVNPHLGTKSYKQFSFPAIYTLSIYSDATLPSHWHTLRYNPTGTVAPPGKKIFSAKFMKFHS